MRTLHGFTCCFTFAVMLWIVRRLIAPFALGSLVCILLLVICAIWSSQTHESFGPGDFAMFALFVLPFEVIGFCLLVPIALFVCNLSFPRPVYPMLLAAVGAIIGVVVVLPIADDAPPLDFALPTACGMVSAMIWFACNQDAIKGRA